MIDNKIDELFKTIEDSKEYQEYKKIGDILAKDKKISLITNEIKSLQQEATILEYNNDPRYEEVDKIIQDKVKELESIPAYQEYLSKMQEFNSLLATSSKMLEDYVNEKI